MNKLLKANFIGCGKLGKTMAAMFVKNNLIFIENILTTSEKSSHNAIELIGQGKVCLEINLLSHADIYFICTPDKDIEILCEKIIQIHKPSKESIFIHFSGLCSSQSLQSAKQYGCGVGSLHPVKSFSNLTEDINSFQGTYCGFEGEDPVKDLMSHFITKIGGILFSIEKENKALYHASAIFSGNYITTLAFVSLKCFENAGVPTEIAKNITLSLMNSVMSNLSSAQQFQDALTGPIQRGDCKTIEQHLVALENFPNFKEIYTALGKQTVELAKHDVKLKDMMGNFFRMKKIGT